MKEPMSRRRLPLLPALLACAGLCPAAELVVRDVRAAVLVRPGDFDFALDSDLIALSGEDAFDSGTGLELGTRYSFARPGSSWGLVVGGDAAADWYTYADDQGMASYGVRACAGLGWAISDRWTVVGEAGLGYGFADLELPATGAAPAFSADGDGLFYDARLSAIFFPARRWSVHAHVGWLISEYDLEGDGVELELEQSGLYAGLGLTWLFSTKPRGLE